MPTMYEIYDSFSFQYDELVSKEDYQKNLQKFIQNEFNSNIQTVLEIGVGTGRVTEFYIENVSNVYATDFAQNMIDKAKINLKKFENKIDFKCIDTRKINDLNLKVDCIIEGWTIGHSAIDEYENSENFTSELFQNFDKMLNENGKIILIETMGTAVSEPTIPAKELADFYNLIEQKQNLKRHIITTDYKFENIEEAKRIMSFFFGNEIIEKISSNIVKEFTGVWIGGK
jgi:cyclopropane fatty-acyl-phospholipid synthase-like methyltransferase